MKDKLKQASGKQYKKPKEYAYKRNLIDTFGSQQLTLSEWTANHYTLANHKNILELGCGTGTMWQHLLPHISAPFSLTLTDYKNEMLQHAQSTLKSSTQLPSINFQKMNINGKFSFSSQQFDLVMSHLTLDHADNMKNTIVEVDRVMTKDGVFGVSVQHTDSFSEHMVLAHKIDRNFPEKGVHGSSVSKLENILNCQFSKVSQYNYTSIITWPTSDHALLFTKTLLSISMQNPSEFFYHQYEKSIKDIISKNGSFKTNFKVALFIAQQ